MRQSTTDGLLLVDKPAGMTSHDVVLAARRAFGESRIGHAGTLDPFATGLLVLLLGRATRLLPHLDGVPKEYEATVVLGSETETDDLHGAIVRTAAPPGDEALADAIARLTGPLDQVPPAYSAKRVDGRRAYEAARAGTALELAPARVDAATALAKLLFADGRREEARELVEKLPGFQAEGLAARLRLEELGEDEEALRALDDGDLERAFDLLIDAMPTADGRKDDLRRIVVAELDRLGVDHPLARDTRRRLATALY